MRRQQRIATSKTIAGAAAGGGVVLQVTVTMPPVNAELSEEVMRDMGRAGSHIVGHYWLLGASHYVWYLHDGVGFDPGTYDTATLSGRTGIQVNLAAGNRTAAQVATATASAISTEGTYTAAAATADVVVTGTNVASAGTVTWDDADGDYGIIGMRELFFGGGGFDSAVLRATRIDPATLPASNFIVTGGRVGFAGQHDAQVPIAIYQGGTADDDFENATLLGVVGTTTGSATNALNYFATPTPFVVDPTAGRLWLAWMHDAGQVDMPFSVYNGADAPADTSDFIATAGDGIIISATGPSSSDSANFPASMPAIGGGSFNSAPPMAFSYVLANNFQNDMRVVGMFGARVADPLTFGSTSGGTLLVGNSHASPDTIGMSVRDAAVAYRTHGASSHYRLSLAVGGTAVDNFFGADFTDIGIADSPGIGWVDVVPTPGSIPIPASSQIWIMIHHTSDPSTSLAFDSGAPDVYGPDPEPAPYYNGNTSESEADDGSLGQAASTNISFDENVAQDGVTTPNGFNYQNNNNVGVRMRYAIEGFAVAA